MRSDAVHRSIDSDPEMRKTSRLKALQTREANLRFRLRLDAPWSWRRTRWLRDTWTALATRIAWEGRPRRWLGAFARYVGVLPGGAQPAGGCAPLVGCPLSNGVACRTG